MALGGVFMTLNNAMLKWVADYPTGEIFFVRSSFTVLSMMAVVALSRRPARLRVVSWKGHALRAATMVVSATCFILAPRYLPLGETFAYLEGRPYAPQGAAWDKAVAYWRMLPTDDGATFDSEVTVDGNAIAPMVPWGNSPENVVQVTDTVPDPKGEPNTGRRESLHRALDYMALTPGTPMTEIAVDRVFIGSCTSSRIEDLRRAAAVAKGRKAVIPAMVSPGSTRVKNQAESEGLDKIFAEAGFDWRHSACSMCVGLNGDSVAPGERTASTSNRNFRGRQGRGSRTHLVSPVMAAAAAVTGKFTDVRRLMEGR